MDSGIHNGGVYRTETTKPVPMMLDLTPVHQSKSVTTHISLKGPLPYAELVLWLMSGDLSASVCFVLVDIK